MVASTENQFIRFLTQNDVLSREDLQEARAVKDRISSFYPPINIVDVLLYHHHLSKNSIKKVIGVLVKKQLKDEKEYRIDPEDLLPSRMVHPMLSNPELGKKVVSRFLVEREEYIEALKTKEQLSDHDILKSVAEIFYEQSAVSINVLEELYEELQQDADSERDENDLPIEKISKDTDLSHYPSFSSVEAALIWMLISRDIIDDEDILDVHQWAKELGIDPSHRNTLSELALENHNVSPEELEEAKDLQEELIRKGFEPTLEEVLSRKDYLKEHELSALRKYRGTILLQKIVEVLRTHLVEGEDIEERPEEQLKIDTVAEHEVSDNTSDVQAQEELSTEKPAVQDTSETTETKGSQDEAVDLESTVDKSDKKSEQDREPDEQKQQISPNASQSISSRASSIPRHADQVEKVDRSSESPDEDRDHLEERDAEVETGEHHLPIKLANVPFTTLEEVQKNPDLFEPGLDTENIEEKKYDTSGSSDEKDQETREESRTEEEFSDSFKDQPDPTVQDKHETDHVPPPYQPSDSEDIETDLSEEEKTPDDQQTEEQLSRIPPLEEQDLPAKPETDHLEDVDEPESFSYDDIDASSIASKKRDERTQDDRDIKKKEVTDRQDAPKSSSKAALDQSTDHVSKGSSFDIEQNKITEAAEDVFNHVPYMKESSPSDPHTDQAFEDSGTTEDPSAEDSPADEKEETVLQTKCVKCQRLIRYPGSAQGERRKCTYCKAEQQLPKKQDAHSLNKMKWSRFTDAEKIHSMKDSSKQLEDVDSFYYQCVKCKRVFHIAEWLEDQFAICDFCDQIQKIQDQNLDEDYPDDAENQKPIEVPVFPRWLATPPKSVDNFKEIDRETYLAQLSRKKKTNTSSRAERFTKRFKIAAYQMVFSDGPLWKDALRITSYLLLLLLMGSGVYYLYINFQTRASTPIVVPDHASLEDESSEEKTRFERNQPPALSPGKEQLSTASGQEIDQLHHRIAMLLSLRESPVHLVYQIPPSSRIETFAKAFQLSWSKHYRDPLNYDPDHHDFLPPGTVTSHPDVWLDVYAMLVRGNSQDIFTKLRLLKRIEERISSTLQQYRRMSIIRPDTIPRNALSNRPSLRRGIKSLTRIAESSRSRLTSSATSILKKYTVRSITTGSGIRGSIWFTWLLMELYSPDNWNQLEVNSGAVGETFKRLRNSNHMRSELRKHFSQDKLDGFLKQFQRIMFSFPRNKEDAIDLKKQLEKPDQPRAVMAAISYLMGLPGWRQDIHENIFVPAMLDQIDRIASEGISNKKEMLQAIVRYATLQNQFKIYQQVRKLMYRFPWAVPEKLRSEAAIQFGDPVFFNHSRWIKGDVPHYQTYSAMFREPQSVSQEANNILRSYIQNESDKQYPKETLKQAIRMLLMNPDDDLQNIDLLSTGMTALNQDQYEIAELSFRHVQISGPEKKTNLWKLTRFYLHQYQRAPDNISNNNTSSNESQSKKQNLEETDNSSPQHQEIRLHTDKQKRLVRQRIIRAVLLQEAVTDNFLQSFWSRLTSYAEEQPKHRTAVNHVKKELVKSYRRHYPALLQRFPEDVSEQYSKLIHSRSNGPTSQLVTTDNVEPWTDVLNNFLKEIRSRENLLNLQSFILDPQRAYQIFGKNGTIPDQIHKQIRKSQNLLYLSVYPAQVQKNTSFKISRIQNGTVQSLEPGDPYPQFDQSIQLNQPITIRKQVKWKLHWNNQQVMITGDLLKLPLRPDRKEQQYVWKAFRLNISDSE